MQDAPRDNPGQGLRQLASMRGADHDEIRVLLFGELMQATDRRLARQRHRLQRRLQGGVRQLQRTFGPQPLTVVVQERLDGGRRAGCHRVYQRPDGTPTTLIRLALTLGEHRLTVDELLAALVDECVAMQDPPPSTGGFEALFADLGAARNGVPM